MVIRRRQTLKNIDLAEAKSRALVGTLKKWLSKVTFSEPTIA